jgi:DNA-directed RNA polymerase specialized sigma24 family protein
VENEYEHDLITGDTGEVGETDAPQPWTFCLPRRIDTMNQFQAARNRRRIGPLPIDVWERDWQRELHRPAMRSQFRAWQDTDAALSRFEDVRALLHFLRGRGSRVEKDAVLSALLTRARWEPLAARVVLEAILPGLKKLSGRLLTDSREREELWSAVMACAWERIRTYPVERRPRRVAANLLLDTLRGTLAALSTRRSPDTQTFPAQLEAPPPCDSDVDALLAQAVAAGAVSEDEAELILLTRIDGASLKVLAADRGLSFDTLKHRRHRAERRLVVFLGARPVPQRGLERPFSAARVAGVGPSGLAGGDDQPTH